MLIDSHAHLDFVDDLEGALVRAQGAGVGKIITVGTTIAESKNAVNLALSCSRPGLDKRITGLEVYATTGIHPKDGKDDVEKFGVNESIHRLREIARSSKKIVAIGECGLDYYVTSDTRPFENFQGKQETSEKEKKLQRKLFEGQIKLAVELDLPLVVHCRNGWDEIFDLISNFIRSGHSRGSENQILNQVQDDDSGMRGVFHSWTGDWSDAKKALDLGFYISFSGIVTFKQSLRSSQAAGLKNAPDVQEVAKKVPLDRILIETDSPFLTPEPLRGKKNEPGNVKIVCQFIADLRNEPFDLVASNTLQNAQKLFSLL